MVVIVKVVVVVADVVEELSTEVELVVTAVVLLAFVLLADSTAVISRVHGIEYTSTITILSGTGSHRKDSEQRKEKPEADHPLTKCSTSCQQ